MVETNLLVSRTSRFPIVSRESINILFLCHTAGLSYGNYTVSAYVSSVPGETNTANNNCTEGILQVTIPGDIKGDGKVTLVDLVSMAVALGSTRGSPKWNPSADISDDKVSLADLVILATHYRRHNP